MHACLGSTAPRPPFDKRLPPPPALRTTLNGTPNGLLDGPHSGGLTPRQPLPGPGPNGAISAALLYSPASTAAALGAQPQPQPLPLAGTVGLPMVPSFSALAPGGWANVDGGDGNGHGIFSNGNGVGNGDNGGSNDMFLVDEDELLDGHGPCFDDYDDWGNAHAEVQLQQQQQHLLAGAAAAAFAPQQPVAGGKAAGAGAAKLVCVAAGTGGTGGTPTAVSSQQQVRHGMASGWKSMPVGHCGVWVCFGRAGWAKMPTSSCSSSAACARGVASIRPTLPASMPRPRPRPWPWPALPDWSPRSSTSSLTD